MFEITPLGPPLLSIYDVGDKPVHCKPGVAGSILGLSQSVG